MGGLLLYCILLIAHLTRRVNPTSSPLKSAQQIGERNG
jgi:hypothetical protein